MELLRALLLLLSFAVINNLTAGYELSEIHESIDTDLSKYKNQGEVYAIHLNSWKDYTYEYHYNRVEEYGSNGPKCFSNICSEIYPN